MRICLIGDNHWRKNLPYGSAFPDERREEWNEVIRTIHKTAKDCEEVVLLGDIFNAKNNPSSVIRDFVEFLKGFGNKQVHMITGNHSISPDGTALDFLQKMEHENWHVYTKPTIVDNMAFVPFLRSGEYDPSFLSGRKVIALFSHNAVKPSTRGAMIDETQEHVWGKEYLELHSDFSAFGHIHDEEKVSDTIQGAGSIFTNVVGEHKRAIWKYDTTTKETERIPLPVRGIYKVMINEPMNGFDEIPEHSIVKCVVTQKGADLVHIEELMKRFDAYMIVESYNEGREKHHFETGAIDISLDSLLKVYAKERKIDYEKLMQGVNLLNS